jgi:hypothetical protein
VATDLDEQQERRCGGLRLLRPQMLLLALAAAVELKRLLQVWDSVLWLWVKTPHFGRQQYEPEAD